MMTIVTNIVLFFKIVCSLTQLIFFFIFFLVQVTLLK